MANLRRPLRPQPVAPAAPVRAPMLRWPVMAAVAVAALLVLAWIDGGEEPLRRVVQAVQLPEQPR